MRLREIQAVIEANLPELRGFEFEYISNTGYRTKMYSQIFLAIIKIEQLGFIDDEHQDLVTNELLVNSSSTDSVIFSQQKMDIFDRNVNRIIWKSEACLDLIKQNLHSEKEDENSLIISMPDRNLSFNEFNDIVKILNETLRLLNFLPAFQSDIQLSNFDVGSEWFVVSFVTSQAVKMFGKISTLVQRTQVGIKQNKALDIQLESLNLDAETLSKFKQAAVEANTKIYQDLSNEFLVSENIADKEQYLGQMTKVIENTDKLMNIGVGFEAAITATTEVANTFPPLIEQKRLDKIKTIDSIKKIDSENNSIEKED